MKYKSNLTCPDLSPQFKLLDPPMQHCGHDIPSDPDYDPACGYWSHDEAAILYTVARAVGGTWLDIGARFGWTAAHVAVAGVRMVHCIDPHFTKTEFRERFALNTKGKEKQLLILPWTSTEFFSNWRRQMYSGIVIDGNHDEPEPLNDAMNAALKLEPRAVILLHDFLGKPTRDAANWLLDAGFKCRIYWTPNLVALCWRGAFVPPEHIGDKNILWKPHLDLMKKDFDFRTCDPALVEV